MCIRDRWWHSVCTNCIMWQWLTQSQISAEEPHFGCFDEKMFGHLHQKYLSNFVDRFWWFFCSPSLEEKKCWWSEYVIPQIQSSVFIITFDTNDPFPKNTWYFVLLLAAHCLLKNLFPKLKGIHQTAVVALTPTLEMPLWLYCSQRCLFTQNRVGGL